MGQGLRGFLWGLFGFYSFVSGGAAPPSANYIGVLHNEKLGRDMVARLDLIRHASDADKDRFYANLTLYLGDFKSPEYLDYFYSNVFYEKKTDALVFERGDEVLALKFEKLHNRWDTLNAKVLSSLSGKVIGRLELHQAKEVKPSRPLLEPLGGEYVSTCGEKPLHLQVRVTRNDNDFGTIGDPLADYDIHGVTAREDPRLTILCPKWLKRPCVKGNFRASYNLSRNTLQFYGTGNGFSCTPVPRGLQCDDCLFRRVSGETAEPRVFQNPKTWSLEGKKQAGCEDVDKDYSQGPVSPEELEGEYAGYLFHERRGIGQRVRLSLLASFLPDGNKVRLMSAASVLFGSWDAAEVIPHPFDSTVVDFSHGEFNMVLARPMFREDAIVHIQKIQNQRIDGVWYSPTFGRVGPFYVVKGQEPPPPPGVDVEPAVGGVYQWTDYSAAKGFTYEIFLPVLMGKSIGSVANPFSPLSMMGFYKSKQGVFPLRRIPGGTYDFYTGRINIGNQWVGERLPNRAMRLSLLHQNSGLPLQFVGGDEAKFLQPMDD